MKKAFLFLLLSIIAIPNFAQGDRRISASRFHFIKEIDCSDYTNKRFRYEIAVRSPEAFAEKSVKIEVASSINNVEIKKPASIVESRREQEWVIFSVMGTIGTQCEKLSFRMIVNGKGQFYFDDVNLYIEENPSKWKQLTLHNPSFEEESTSVPGYIINNPRNTAMTYTLSRDVYKVGKQSLLVETTDNRFILNFEF